VNAHRYYVEVFEDTAGEWRWRRKGMNHESTATSEGYTRRADALEAAFRDNPDAVRIVTLRRDGTEEEASGDE